MKIVFLVVGKTIAGYLKDGIQEYEKRMKHYASFEMRVIPDLKNTKNMSPEIQKEKEGESILSFIDDQDYMVLLDENGKQFTSVDFSKYLENKFHSGIKRMIFVVGGAYGFSNPVYQKAKEKISLSKLTFSHQMVRLIFVEQLYRAYTIIRGEPYHHQ